MAYNWVVFCITVLSGTLVVAVPSLLLNNLVVFATLETVVFIIAFIMGDTFRLKS